MSWKHLASVVASLVVVGASSCQRGPDGALTFKIGFNLPQFLAPSQVVADSSHELVALLGPVLAEIVTGHLDEAVEKAGIPESQRAWFRLQASRPELAKIESLVWRQATVEINTAKGRLGTVVALARLSDPGDPLKLTFELARDGERWRLTSLDVKATSAPQDKSLVQQLWSNEVEARSVENVTTAIFESIETKDCTPLWRTFSAALKRQSSVASLNEKFRHVFASGVLTPGIAEGAKLTFVEVPSIDLSGHYNLKGVYQLKGMRYRFSYQLQLEDAGWAVRGYEFGFIEDKKS